MSTYKELAEKHGSDTMINYESFNQDILDEHNKSTDVNVVFTKKSLKIFIEKFYDPLMRKLTSFPNIFKLVEFLKSCYDTLDSLSDIEKEIEKLYKTKPDIPPYKAYNKIFTTYIKHDIDDEILWGINEYGEEETEIEPIDDIIYLKIDSENVEAVINKIQKRNEKLFKL